MEEDGVYTKEILEFSDILSVMKLTHDYIEKTDKLNKRLVTALIAFIISAAVTLIAVTGFYFKFVYGYDESIEQIQPNINQKIERGVN